MHLISSLLSLFDCISLSAYIRNLIHNAVALGAMERRPNGKEVDTVSGIEYYCYQWSRFCHWDFFSGFLSYSFALLFSAADFARRLDSGSIF